MERFIMEREQSLKMSQTADASATSSIPYEQITNIVRPTPPPPLNSEHSEPPVHVSN